MLQLTPYTVHKFTVFTHKRTAGSYMHCIACATTVQLVAYCLTVTIDPYREAIANSYVPLKLCITIEMRAISGQ